MSFNYYNNKFKSKQKIKKICWKYYFIFSAGKGTLKTTTSFNDITLSHHNLPRRSYCVMDGQIEKL